MASDLQVFGAKKLRGSRKPAAWETDALTVGHCGLSRAAQISRVLHQTKSQVLKHWKYSACLLMRAQTHVLQSYASRDGQAEHTI